MKDTTMTGKKGKDKLTEMIIYTNFTRFIELSYSFIYTLDY